MIARRISIPTGAAGQSWIVPVVVSLSLHAAAAAGVVLWQGAVVPPAAPAVFTVEVVTVAVPPGAEAPSVESVPAQAGSVPGEPTAAKAVETAVQAAPVSPGAIVTVGTAEPAPEAEMPTSVIGPSASAEPIDPVPPAAAQIDSPETPALSQAISLSAVAVIEPVLLDPVSTAAAQPVAAVVPARGSEGVHSAVYAPRPRTKPIFHPSPVAKEVLRGHFEPPPEVPVRAALLPDIAPASDAAAGSVPDGAMNAPVVPPRFAAAGLANPLPAYPRRARRRGLEGRLVLRVTVDSTGRPRDVSVIDSSGHALLDEAAVRAVRRWRFEPGRRAGIAVPASVDVPVIFRLDR